MKVCLVTVCIGEYYLSEYNRLFRPSQEKYAKRCGYDFKVISDYISEPKHPHTVSFNKALVCDYPWDTQYDILIFIDADIMIHPKSPPLHNYYDFGDKIGVVNQSQPTLEARILSQTKKGSEITAKDYYQLKSGHTIESDHIINTGVLVIQPSKHSNFLRNIFQTYIKNQIDNTSGFHYEQSVIGYELLKNNMYYYMDMKWNALWASNKYYTRSILNIPITLQEFYDKHYFIHFAGQCDFHLIPKLK